VNVVHLHESCKFFIRRFVCIDDDRVVFLWIVDQQCTQQLPALNVAKSIEDVVNRSFLCAAVHTMLMNALVLS